jgi:hypothetical protein
VTARVCLPSIGLEATIINRSGLRSQTDGATLAWYRRALDRPCQRTDRRAIPQALRREQRFRPAPPKVQFR